MGRRIKWPKELLLFRHDVSQYNILKKIKKEHDVYQKFRRHFETNPECAMTIALARQLADELALEFSDPATPLLEHPSRRAKETGQALKKIVRLPDVIFVSPYLRTMQTYEGLCDGWPELRNVRMFEEERIREQDHGLAALYNDWRIFQALYPDQRRLYRLWGLYSYCYPQGENVPNVRERARQWNSTITRDFRNKRVWAVTHHLFILAYLANMQRWNETQFIDYDTNRKPLNCGVTLFQCNPDKGENGRFELTKYSARLFTTEIDSELTESTCSDSTFDEVSWKT